MFPRQVLRVLLNVTDSLWTMHQFVRLFADRCYGGSDIPLEVDIYPAEFFDLSSLDLSRRISKQRRLE